MPGQQTLLQTVQSSLTNCLGPQLSGRYIEYIWIVVIPCAVPVAKPAFVPRNLVLILYCFQKEVSVLREFT